MKLKCWWAILAKRKLLKNWAWNLQRSMQQLCFRLFNKISGILLEEGSTRDCILLCITLCGMSVEVNLHYKGFLRILLCVT